MSLIDQNWMKKALRLAVRGRGNVSPNPPVGCILVKKEKVIGRGWTQPSGRPHAEVMALKQAGERAKGATAYCTLEPCAHFGKTPPCCDALIEAGISQVIVAAKDPDPRVNGQGIKRLREAGINVVENVCKENALEVMQGFFHVQKFARPFVTLKLGMSIDSRLATIAGQSKWITGDQARRSVHLLRAKNDAILTGVGTIIRDDPQLNCRLPGLEEYSPTRILVDSKLRLPVDSQFAQTASKHKSFVFTTDKADASKTEILNNMGVNVFQISSDKGEHVSMPQCLKKIAQEGTTTVLVETGSTLSTSLLQNNLIDKLVVYRAPTVIGGDGIAAWHPLGVEHLSESKTFAIQKIEQIGTDIEETYILRAEVL